MSSDRRVLRDVKQHSWIESGPRRLPAGDRVAVVASWGPDEVVSRSLSELVRGLDANGYAVVVSRASDDRRPLVWPDGIPPAAIVLRKPNLGYDFGSWAVALKKFPAIARRPYVILANDSLVGPFAPIDELVADFERSQTDVWAATSTTQIYQHLQSFFLGFRGGVLADGSLKRFWRNITHETDKDAIIARYEFGLSRLLGSEGFTTSACYPSGRIVSPTENPAIEGWQKLLDLGFPFVKRELLLDPEVTQDAATVPAVLRERFGVDAHDWL